MVQILQQEQRQPGFLESLLGSSISSMDKYSQEKSKERALEKEYKLKGELEQEKYNYKSLADLESDKKNYQTISDTFGKKFADVWLSSPQGGKTELLKLGIDSIQRGNDLEELLGGISIPEQNNVGISPEESMDLPKKPKGITPKEWAKQKSTQLYEVNKPVIKELGDIRKNIPIQEQAIEDLMEAAPGVGLRDWLADTFEIEPFRTESGAKLKTALKDFFLSDISRVGARPNMWVEKQLFASLPTIGRDPVSNMITTAGLKFKKDLSKRRMEIIDELSDKYGYSGIDLDKTANKMMKSYVIERQKLLEDEIRSIKNRENKLSGKMIDIVGPDGEEYEVDESEVEFLPEGYLIR